MKLWIILNSRFADVGSGINDFKNTNFILYFVKLSSPEAHENQKDF